MRKFTYGLVWRTRGRDNGANVLSGLGGNDWIDSGYGDDKLIRDDGQGVIGRGNVMNVIAINDCQWRLAA